MKTNIYENMSACHSKAMDYEELLEFKRRVEFNKTEAETLVKLVNSAINRGEKAQRDLEVLGSNAAKIKEFMEQHRLLHTEVDLRGTTIQYKKVLGVDGSFQLAGGPGGKWYAPISVARILFSDGGLSQPEVNIFWAGIEEIDEQENPKPNVVATMLMLSSETKAILDWGSRNEEGIILIDGPIVDPPVISIGGKRYIQDRAEALKLCDKSGPVIGCVKRVRDKSFISFLASLDQSPKELLMSFPSDQHLVAHVFAQVRRSGYSGALFTNWIDMSENNIYKIYATEGVYVASFFFQKSVTSQVLRLDIMSQEQPLDSSRIDAKFIRTARIALDWTLPGQDYPLPVFLAHIKCNIREGAAEVLYDEILTKSRTTDPWNQLVLDQLR